MKIKRALVQTVASRFASLVFTALGMAVLARLLSPVDFGAFALALTVFVIAETLVTLGGQAYLVRLQALDRDVEKSVFGVCLLAASLVTLTTIALMMLAPPPPPLRDLGILFAGALLAKPFLIVTEAARQRSLDFRLLSGLTVLRTAADVFTAIALAAMGFGPAALAAGILVERWLGAIVLIIFSENRSFLRPSLSQWSSFRLFGLRLTAINLAPRAANFIIVAGVNSVLGAAALGLLNRARVFDSMLDNALLTGIKPVILPALSRSLEEGIAPSEIYLTKTEQLAVVSWPLFLVIGILAEPLVAVLLGDQWDAVAQLVRIFALMGLAVPFTRMSAKLFVALDQIEPYLRIQFLHQAALLCLAGGAIFISLEAVAAGFVAALWLKAIVITLAVKRFVPYRPAALMARLSKCVAIAGVSAVGPAAVVIGFNGVSPLLQLVMAGGLAAAGWLISVVLVGHPILAEARAYHAARGADV